VEANGHPGLLVSRDGDDVALLTTETRPEGITTLRWVMNPVKLRSFTRSRLTHVR
jgi:RNA polymerase sigma-70 factor (ECF subfamily)